jgi:predicted ribonuclease YlaK
MTDSDRLIQRLDLVHATPDERVQAVILFGTAGIDKALAYCAALEVVKALDEYQPVSYVVDAVELPF